MAKRCKSILYGPPPTEDDKKFLMKILLMHPNASEKIGCGVKDFFVGKGCFWLVRQDNSTTDFSYIKCLQGKHYPLQEFSMCCRAAVSEYVFYIKLKLYNEQNVDGFIVCPISGQKVDFSNIHIDHHKPKFREIVRSFIKDNNIEVSSDMVARGDKQLGIKFRDIELAKRFLEYHNKIATFRLLSKTANISIK